MIRAHFDGKAIVPDEPVDLPVDAPLEVRVQLQAVADLLKSVPALPQMGSSEDQRHAWDDFVTVALSAPPLSLDSLRRERMYEENL